MQGGSEGAGGVTQGAEGSHRVLGNSERGSGCSRLSQSSLGFVPWCDRCQTLVWTRGKEGVRCPIHGPWTGLSHMRAVPHLGGTRGTPQEHKPEPPALPQVCWAARCPCTALPCPRALWQRFGFLLRVLHLVPVPGRATPLCAHFDVPLLSPAPSGGSGRVWGRVRAGDLGKGWVQSQPGNPRQRLLWVLGSRNPPVLDPAGAAPARAGCDPQREGEEIRAVIDPESD